MEAKKQRILVMARETGWQKDTLVYYLQYQTDTPKEWIEAGGATDWNTEDIEKVRIFYGKERGWIGPIVEKAVENGIPVELAAIPEWFTLEETAKLIQPFYKEARQAQDQLSAFLKSRIGKDPGTYFGLKVTETAITPFHPLGMELDGGIPAGAVNRILSEHLAGTPFLDLRQEIPVCGILVKAVDLKPGMSKKECLDKILETIGVDRFRDCLPFTDQQELLEAVEQDPELNRVLEETWDRWGRSIQLDRILKTLTGEEDVLQIPIKDRVSLLVRASLKLAETYPWMIKELKDLPDTYAVYDIVKKKYLYYPDGCLIAATDYPMVEETVHWMREDRILKDLRTIRTELPEGILLAEDTDNEDCPGIRIRLMGKGTNKQVSSVYFEHGFAPECAKVFVNPPEGNRVVVGFMEGRDKRR